MTKYLIAGLSAIALIAASAFWGYTKGEARADVVIANYESEIARLESDLANKQTEIVTNTITEYVDRVETITETETVYQRIIDTVEIEVPVEATCEISEGWVNLHNAAALEQIIDEEVARFQDPSGVNEYDALRVVIENYAIADRNEEKLAALQKWIRETYESVNNEELSYDE